MKNKTPETTSTRKTNPHLLNDKRKQTLITLPDTKTKIGDYEYAFFLCKQLTSITIPDSVTEIKHYCCPIKLYKVTRHHYQS